MSVQTTNFVPSKVLPSLQARHHSGFARGIHVNVERLLDVQKSQHQFRSDDLLQLVECF